MGLVESWIMGPRDSGIKADGVKILGLRGSGFLDTR